MANKYTSIGLYKKPSETYKDGTAIPENKQKAFISVFMKKDGPQSITLNKGDILSFTTKANKLQELNDSLNNKKISEDTYNFLAEMYGADDVIAEVTLVQKDA